MADFIAVIRRAVDGLSENTPEMRAKVYDRAKSAVVRQLENMKPRPPEAMFQKQLDKLDAAIREVEAEHAEALPAEDVTAPVLQENPEDIEPEPAAAAPPPAAEPVTALDTAPTPAAPAAQRELIPESAFRPLSQPRREEPAKAPVAEQAGWTAEVAVQQEKAADVSPKVEPEPVVPAYTMAEKPVEEEPVARLEQEAHPAQLDVKPYETVPEISSQDEIATEAPVEADAPIEPVYQPFVTVGAAPEPVSEATPAPARSEVAEPVAAHPDANRTEEQSRAWADDAGKQAETAELPPVQQEPAPSMPKVSYDESDVVAGFNDFLKQELNRQVVPPPPAKARKQDDFSWDAPFDDLPEIKKPDAFEKALEAKQRELAAEKGSGNGKGKQPQQRTEPVSARAELEDLLGIEPAQRRGAQVSVDESGLPPDVNRAMSKLEGRSFKMPKKAKKAKRNFRFMPLALAGVGVLVVAGGGYAFWHYRSEVSQVVAGLMPAQDTGKPADTANTEVTSETRSPVLKTAAETAQTKQATNTEVASLNDDIGPQKFTQRLLPDGTETDTDTAKVPIDKALPEGKTVANQTEKGKEVAETTTDTKTDATSTNPAQADAQPIAATQKMFLYEERLGQTSPVAVPGTVVWKEKADTEDGKPEPAIEASLDVPGRKIAALITFKRNTDPSLPASHIIEIVFDLPKDFEEGNVDSIQRVAFKQTEQDRGNPLIAVPAKITDDFHMVALNDDADARKVNLELMKTRSWIDIPITYRNGRRALITLEKGATGTAVFDKVMAEWDALGAQTSNNN